MQIGKYIVEYLEEEHIYLVNGIILPSITQIIKSKFPIDETIPEEVLESARNRGNRVHKIIEVYETTGDELHCQELDNYIKLKKRNDFKVIDVEKIVVLEMDNHPVACGRLDQLIEINGELAINDLKSTSKLDMQYLYYQTNLYRIAHNQTYGTQIEKCYATHLKGNEYAFKRVLTNDEIVLQIVRDYLAKQESEIDLLA